MSNEITNKKVIARSNTRDHIDERVDLVYHFFHAIMFLHPPFYIAFLLLWHALFFYFWAGEVDAITQQRFVCERM